MNNNKILFDLQEKAFDNSKIIAEQLEKKCREKNSYTPLPLQRETKLAKPFPFESLGLIAGAAARRIHEVVQAPDATCGQSILAALALACQAFVDVENDGRISPTSLFMLTISESGERKSATDKLIVKPIYDWQKILIQQHKQQLVDYKNKYDLWKRKRELALKSSLDSSNDKHLLDFEQEPKPPCEGLILCDEPTLEGLEQLLEKGQPSAGVFSDEGGRLVGGHAMNAENALKTACGLSTLWDGKPLTRVRKSEESKIHYGRRLSMHLMIQPIVLTELMTNKMLMGQGVLARCLFSAPAPLAGTRRYKEIDLTSDSHILAFHHLINKILDRPYPKLVKDALENPNTFNPGDALNPKLMKLEDIAKPLWIKFHDDIERKMAKNETYYQIKPFASKASEQALRIAAIFAFAEQLSNSDTDIKIKLEHISRAITLVEYYLDEALRILGHCACDPKISFALQTLEWIECHRPDQVFPLSDVYQYGPTQIRNSKLAAEIMGILEQHYHVIKISDAIIKGSKVRCAWKLIKTPD